MGKKGKYAHVIDLLPRSLGTEPDFQAKVNGVKAAILEPRAQNDPGPFTEEFTASSDKELSMDALDDLLLEVTALLKVINDALICTVDGQRYASTFARRYRNVRVVKAALEAQEKITNVVEEAYKQVLAEQYEAEGTTNIALEDGGSVRTQYEPHATVNDKRANRIWAVENGLEDSLALPWQTVNAIAKELLLKGEEPPAGVELTARVKVVYTK